MASRAWLRVAAALGVCALLGVLVWQVRGCRRSRPGAARSGAEKAVAAVLRRRDPEAAIRWGPHDEAGRLTVAVSAARAAGRPTPSRFARILRPGDVVIRAQSTGHDWLFVVRDGAVVADMNNLAPDRDGWLKWELAVLGSR